MACKGSGVQIPSAPHKNMKKFVLETKELLFSQSIVAILAIIQIRIVAKTLGPESYGIIGVYLGVIGLSFRFLNSRNSDLVLINLKNYKKNFLVSSIYFELCLGIISSLFIFIGLSLPTSLNFFELTSIPDFIYLFIFSRVVFNILEVIKGVYTFKGELKAYSSIETLSSILRFILVVIFILNDPSVASFFYALSFHQLLISALATFILLKNNKSSSETMSFVDYFKNSKNNFLKIRTDQVVGLIPAHLDVVIIGYYADFYSAGIYRIAKKLVDPINYLVVAFSPWMLSQIEKINFRYLTIKILLPISILLITFYTLIGNYLIILVAGSEFRESYSPMLLLLVGYICYLMLFWTRHYLFLNNLISKHTIARLLNLLVFIFSSSFLIESFLYNGIAVSISLGIFAQKLYELFAYSRKR